MDLIFNSLLFAAIAASIAAIVGFFFFRALVGFSQRIQLFLLGAAAVCLLLPTFLYAGAWMDLAMKLALPTQSISLAAFVLALQLWPLVLFFLWAAFHRLDRSLIEAAHLSLQGRRIWMRILIPLLANPFLLGWMIVFILALNQFVIPTTFQIRVQIAEMYVMFSSLYDTKGALLQSLPILILSLVSLFFVARWAKAFRSSNRHSTWNGVRIFPFFKTQRIWKVILLVGVLSVSLLPPSWRLVEALLIRKNWAPLHLAPSHFLASFTYAAGSAVLACLFGLLLWLFLRRSKLFCVIEGLSAVPFIVSGFFLGVLMIAVNQQAGAWAWWSGTWILGIFALALRFLWIPLRAAAHANNQIPSDHLDAAKVFGLSASQVFRNIEWPAMRGMLGMGAWIIYLLALWDVETLLLIYPPGGEPVSLRIFQLLHYGYETEVAVLSSGLILLGLLPGILVFVFSKGKHLVLKGGLAT
jgi:iron(III) transport system permease protein